MRWLALMLVVWPTLASAGRVLTLEGALRLAQQRNRGLQVSRLEVAAALAREEAALAPLLPQASSQVRVFRNFREVTFGLGEVLAAAPPGSVPPGLVAALSGVQSTLQKREQIDASISATVPLIVPAAYGQVRATRAQRRAAASKHRATENDILFGVARLFFGVASTEEILAARKSAVKVAQEALRTTRVRRRAGVVRSVEVSRAELLTVRARQALREAADGVRAARRALARALALPEPARVEAPDTPASPLLPEGDLVRRALARRPDLRAARDQVSAAEQGLSATRWRFAPNLLAFATLRGSNAQPIPFSGTNFAWSAGVLLDVPLFSGGKRFSDVRLARTRLRQARLRLRELADGVATEVRDRRDALLTAREGLRAAERAVRLAKSTLELVQIQRQVGTATQLEEIDAMDARVRAEIARAQSRFGLALAELALKRATGQPVQGP